VKRQKIPKLRVPIPRTGGAMKSKKDYDRKGDKVRLKEEIANKDTSVIPFGDYCYRGKYACPYHRFIFSRPEQENGWCDYLGTGDYEMNRTVPWTDTSGKTNTAEELGLPFSLLWDMCKECGINEP
jgi:hypothetical protein